MVERRTEYVGGKPYPQPTVTSNCRPDADFRRHIRNPYGAIVDLLKNHPHHRAPGASNEVHEMMPMPDISMQRMRNARTERIDAVPTRDACGAGDLTGGDGRVPTAAKMA